jgi:hypothetical protein
MGEFGIMSCDYRLAIADLVQLLVDLQLTNINEWVKLLQFL